MRVKEFEKAKELIERIKQIDETILALDKLGLRLSEKDTPVEIMMKFNKDKDKDGQREPIFDEDGSLRLGGSISGLTGLLSWSSVPSEPKDDRDEISFEISGILSLKTLSGIINNLSEAREKMIKSAETKYGITL